MALLVVKMNALTEKHKEVWQTIHSLAADLKHHRGLVDMGFCQNAADETEVLLLTTWRDRDALDAYLRSVQFTVLLGIRSLLSKEPAIRIFEDESSPSGGG